MKINDAFTPIFHELSEPMMRLPLNGTQFRILMWVERNAYGRQHAKSASYTWYSIARDIGADRTRTSREGRALLARGILILDLDHRIGIDKYRVKELANGGESAPGAKTHGGESAPKMGANPHPSSYNKERKKGGTPRLGCVFAPPTHSEVAAYCHERGNAVNPQQWLDHYQSNGWMVGKVKMRDWRAAVRTWERNDLNRKSSVNDTSHIYVRHKQD